MIAKLLLGKPCVESICEQVKKGAEKLTFARICAIGFDEPRWNQYATSIVNSGLKYGFDCERVTLQNGVNSEVLFETIEKACCRDDISGVIIQQPLPQEYKKAVEYVAVNKDIDCLNPLSVCKLYCGEEGFRPATPMAVIKLLDYYGIELQGKNIVIVGRGNAVGKPLALMLLQRNATVTVCHTKTVDLSSICRKADIVISACGVAGLITADFVTESTIVIDVGLSFVNGKTRGDVGEDVYEKCYAVSPVPGGVGPVTRATLFLNGLAAAKGN